MRITSITWKLFIYYLALCYFVILLIGVYSFFSAREALLSRTFDQLTSVRVEKQHTVERFFSDRVRDIELLTTTRVVREMLEPGGRIFPGGISAGRDRRLETEFNNYPRIYLESNGYFSAFLLADTTGNFIYAPLGSKDPVASFHFASLVNTSLPVVPLVRRILKSRTTVISDYCRDSLTGAPRLFIGSPVTEPVSGRLRGILLLEIPVAAVNSIMRETTRPNGLGTTGEAYLVGHDFLMRTESRFIPNSIFRTRVYTSGALAAAEGKTGVLTIVDYRGIPVLSSFGKIEVPGLNWSILAEIDSGEAMIPVFTLRNSIFYLGLIVSVLLFGMVYLVTHRVTTPIIQLKEAADQIARGEYKVRLGIMSHDELGALTSSFIGMAAQLEKQNEMLARERNRRMLSMIDGQEQERQRLSRDLHDGLGQSLLAIKMKLEMVSGASPEKAGRILGEVREMLGASIREIRVISNDLMPSVLSAFGIVQGLQTLCNTMSVNTGEEISLDAGSLPPALDATVQIFLFRVAQEALNNVAKHAGALHVKIKAGLDGDMITLSVEDDGRGFEGSPDAFKGNGLINIRERTDLMGGTFRLSARPGQGTRVEVTCPLIRDV